MATQISSDLLWQITRNYNTYLVRRPQSGGVNMSRDPLNLSNLHRRTQEGFVNDEAIGLIPTSNGLTLITKDPKAASSPAKSRQTKSLGNGSGVSKAIQKETFSKGYRTDLNDLAIKRSKAIQRSLGPVKKDRVKSVRGVKAKKAAAEA
ncbi:ribosomal protein L28e [Aulographum hederae CBS 113979]|uniref:Ribosomal protein L28e n=1 Tax=Aulographum hederae CBS 113979 TaxID=1176131 RepID=A0A6G1GYY7_9PEZI|nr:ribosomal protein L28e [Aulographum hederae CBS 113979]